MQMYFVLVFVSSAQIVAAMRVAPGNSVLGVSKQSAVLMGENLQVSPVDDFTFMTTDFRYPGHDAGFFGTIKEWFGGRSTNDEVKEDIVQGHSCASRGGPDETYYASSFCYWLPEFPVNKAGHSGLVWRGGNYPLGKQLSRAIRGDGKCIKTYVCHNNGRGDDGEVQSSSFVEELSLPLGCKKEREIDRECVANYDHLNADLKLEDTRCHEVESRYLTAVHALDTCNSMLSRLPREIAAMPGKIRQAEDNTIRAEERLRGQRRDEEKERRQMHRRCERYQTKKGNLHFYNMLLGATPTEQILSYSIYCSYPHMPIDNKDGNHYDEMLRYRNNKEVYDACKECDTAKDHLRSAKRQVDSAERDLSRARRRVPELRQELANKERQLRDWQSKEPGLKATKHSMNEEWMPQSAGCRHTYDAYKNGKATAVTTCAASLYDNSCEKACIELQASDTGCSVVEGGRPEDGAGLGGVEVTCSPPQPSWVLGPYTYGVAESSHEQCARITNSQKVHYTQEILKSGWLWKKGRVGGWDKRFFVLESGSKVRSAVLRYWHKDPSKVANATERSHKGIILRDAKSVKEKDGDHYGFENGECFKLYHFYRDYRFCVEGDEALSERDEWMDLIKEAIVG